MYIEKINGPADVKRLSAGELETLSEEVRSVLLKKLSEHGGHVGPNLGMVEATIALHYVFNSPIDKIVYDVSHQSYTHKILTGRKAAFMNAAEYDEVSGYTVGKRTRLLRHRTYVDFRQPCHRTGQSA